MKYYAKVFTGNPATGLIKAGDELTEKQVRILGEEKILELCGRGVLGAVKETAEAEDRPPFDVDETEPETAKETETAEETEEELPELGDGADLISETVPEEKPAKKKTSRKGK